MDSEGGDGEAIIELRDRVDPMLQVVLGRSFELGFLGSMPIDEQIDHALGFVAILEKRCGGVPASVIDLGTGGGVPGLVLISCWPDSRVVLMDASARRTGFLQEVVEGWPLAVNAEVVRGRAEELGHQGGLREQFNAVTSRSFGIPAPNGWMVIAEPPDIAPVDRWPSAGLETVGLVAVETIRLADRFGYQVLHKTGMIDGRFPRRVGIPAKRPLF
jgi:16S rRNA (guanine527-N7)-methyltransferase